MPETDPEVLATFAEEASERLSALEDGLLKLERSPGADHAERLNSVFRDAHSIKAGANLLRLKALETAAHRLENVLDSLRKGRLALGDDVIQALLDGVDLLRELLNSPEDLASGELAPRLAALESLAGRATEAA